MKNSRGDGIFSNGTKYNRQTFDYHDRNDVFDDEILAYRDVRAKSYRLPDKHRDDERLLNALSRNLSPIIQPKPPLSSYEGKMETFLTCCAIASYLKERLVDGTSAISSEEITLTFLEETALKAILGTLSSELTLVDKMLFIKELPKLLKLPYPVVEDIRVAGLQIIFKLKENFHSRVEEVLFEIILKSLLNELTLEEKMLFIKKLSEIFNLPYNTGKDFRNAMLQVISKIGENFASKRMWKEYGDLFNDYIALNCIYEFLNLKEWLV